MVKSMTGFGRFENTVDDRKFTVEIKSVNHRFLDMNIKMPKKFGMFESHIRSIIKEYLERGKVDLYITYEDLADADESIKYNSHVAEQYMNYFDKMAKQFNLTNDISVSSLSRFPDVFTMEEQDVDENVIWSILEKALRGALEELVKVREKEGEELKKDIFAKLDEMEGHVDYIEKRSPDIIAEYKQKLTAKINDLLEDKQIDESRLATEVTLYADKICVDEEIVRLHTHIKAMRDTLVSGESVGRKLDFIAQEMNREANTTLSKSTDISINDVGISLKTLIEKIREQIQNIE
ncbi:MAG: YicC family protein [Lachnospiraceae bacterium]|nr:YicC family protein [Lachnospiraceae bacterium]